MNCFSLKAFDNDPNIFILHWKNNHDSTWKKLIWFKKVSKFTYLKYFYNYMNSQNNKKKTYVQVYLD
jgi:hypothetical protein